MTDSDSTRFFELIGELRHERDVNKHLNSVIDGLFIKAKNTEMQMAMLKKENENLLIRAGANGLMLESQRRTIKQLEERVSPWARQG